MGDVPYFLLIYIYYCHFIVIYCDGALDKHSTLEIGAMDKLLLQGAYS